MAAVRISMNVPPQQQTGQPEHPDEFAAEMAKDEVSKVSCRGCE
jgi:hypothetical protein